MSGATPDELVELRSHELPCGTEYIWDWFIRLTNTRDTGFAIGAIKEHELRAFFANRGIVPTRWELDLIVRMDEVARSVAGEKQPTQPRDEE